MNKEVAVNEIKNLVSFLKTQSKLAGKLDNLQTAPYFSTFRFGESANGYKLPWRKGTRLYITLLPNGILKDCLEWGYKRIIPMDGNIYNDTHILTENTIYPPGKPVYIVSPTGGNFILDLY